MRQDRAGMDRQRRRVAVGRIDMAAKALGLGIGFLLGFFVLNLAHAPDSQSRQAELDRQTTLRAEALSPASDAAPLPNLTPY
jgi:hypothetical protein